MSSPASQLLLRAPTSRRPTGLVALTVSFLSPDRASRLHPRFLGDPCVRATFHDPGGRMRLRPWLSATRISVAFDVAGRLGFHDMSPFGTHSAARTLAVYASWPRSPVHCLRPRKTRFRRDGLRRRRWDLHPGSLSEVSGATSFLFSQACPGAPATVTRIGRLWPARTRKRPRKAPTVVRRARRPAPIRFAMPRRAPRVRALPTTTRGGAPRAAPGTLESGR